MITVESKNIHKYKPHQELMSILAQLPPEKQQGMLDDHESLWQLVNSLPVATRRRVSRATPMLAMQYAVAIKKNPWVKQSDTKTHTAKNQEMHDLICTDARAAVAYKDEFRSTDVSVAESLIVQDAALGMYYMNAAYRRERWPELEPVLIAEQNFGRLSEYVSNARIEEGDERWYTGEDAWINAGRKLHQGTWIMIFMKYAKQFFPHGWVAAEEVFARSGQVLEYVTTIKRDRFIAYENYLATEVGCESYHSRQHVRETFDEYCAVMKRWGLSDGLPDMHAIHIGHQNKKAVDAIQ